MLNIGIDMVKKYLTISLLTHTIISRGVLEEVRVVRLLLPSCLKT